MPTRSAGGSVLYAERDLPLRREVCGKQQCTGRSERDTARAMEPETISQKDVAAGPLGQLSRQQLSVRHSGNMPGKSVSGEKGLFLANDRSTQSLRFPSRCGLRFRRTSSRAADRTNGQRIRASRRTASAASAVAAGCRKGRRGSSDARGGSSRRGRSRPRTTSLHQRRPLRGIGGIDVVVLAEAVEREGDREDEEDRDDVELPRDRPAAEVNAIAASTPRWESDRDRSFARDALAQLRLDTRRSSVAQRGSRSGKAPA